MEQISTRSSHSSSTTDQDPNLKRQERIYFENFDVSDQVFYESEGSIGIVNLKPIVKGHVLVIPRRRDVKRLKDLTESEVSELFRSVQMIGKMIEIAYQASSLTVSIQDGPFAGQSVSHLHVHILPRHPNDFNPNDEIYDHLDRFKAFPDTTKPSKGVDNDSRKPRSHEEMRSEANWLSHFFASLSPSQNS